MEKINVVLDWFPNTNHTGFYIALERGYFREVGIDARISGDVHGVLDIDDADMVLGPSISMLEKRGHGAGLTGIATITQVNDSGIVSLKDAEITSPRHLECQRLTHWEPEWFHAVIGEAMRLDGGDYNKVTLVPMDVGDIVATLGAVADATWVYENWENQELIAAGKDINYIRLADVDPLFDFPAPCIAATSQFLNDRPDTARRVLSALERGYVAAAQDPDASVLEVLQHMPSVNPDLLVRSQRHLSTILLDGEGRWGRIAPERWNRMADFLVEKGITGARYRDEFTNDFFA
ncbi:MAG TPA: ABC transporter substrate-binding protein [Thermomicrobiales bacterium]|nr:ABC transporter substrate-binding protein [Thermomicrobiales bacterium]